MRFEQEFRQAFPDTVGETDKEFDLSNYVEWLESLVEEKFTSTNMPSAAAILQAIDDNVECVETPNGKYLNRQQVVDCLNALSGTSHVG